MTTATNSLHYCNGTNDDPVVAFTTAKISTDAAVVTGQLTHDAMARRCPALLRRNQDG